MRLPDHHPASTALLVVPSLCEFLILPIIQLRTDWLKGMHTSEALKLSILPGFIRAGGKAPSVGDAAGRGGLQHQLRAVWEMWIFAFSR